MSQCHSQFIPPSPSPTVYTTSLFSMSATLLLNGTLFCLYSKVQVLWRIFWCVYVICFFCLRGSFVISPVLWFSFVLQNPKYSLLLFFFYLLPSSCQRILLSSFLSFFSSLHFKDDSHKSYLSIKIVPAPLNHSWPFKSTLKSLSCSLCSGHLFCIFRFSVDLIFLASFQIIFRLLQYPSSSRFPTNFLSLLLLAQSLVAVWGESMCTGIDAVSFFYS